MTPELSCFKQHLLSHSFCGSGTQMWLCWGPCFRVSRQAIIKVCLLGLQSPQVSTGERSAFKPTLWSLAEFSSSPAVSQRPPSVLRQVGFSAKWGSPTGQSTSSKHASQEGRRREDQREADSPSLFLSSTHRKQVSRSSLHSRKENPT